MNVIYIVEEFDEENDVGDDLQQPILAQPTVVRVYYATATNATVTNPDDHMHDPPTFNSVEHLVDMVSRMFGSCITHLVLVPPFHDEWRPMEQLFWRHTEQTRTFKRKWWFVAYLGCIQCCLTCLPALSREKASIYGADTAHDAFINPPPTLAFMTPDRALHVHHAWYTEFFYNIDLLYWYLLKVHEVLDVSKDRLLQLRNISLEHYPDGLCLTRFKARIEDGVLWIPGDDFNVSYQFNY